MHRQWRWHELHKQTLRRHHHRLRRRQSRHRQSPRRHPFHDLNVVATVVNNKTEQEKKKKEMKNVQHRLTAGFLLAIIITVIGVVLSLKKNVDEKR